ncbi:MAG: beta-ketoacyl synthase N-terminal-like domain-containing protein [Chloroflexi bacterium]|nr:beta-ketoacyl synthase N-terminal-like domain-containing protein [Chloroflexota bacterium]
MRPVSVVGIGQIPVRMAYPDGLVEMGARVVRLAMQDAGLEHLDALYSGNMLADELQNQKHLAAFIADESGLIGIEAMTAGAASAAGGAALRMAYLAVASGELDYAVAVGVEKMSEGAAVYALAKALDAKREVAMGANMITRNAELMRLYMDAYDVPDDGFVNFAVNARSNARLNPNALFRKRVSARKVRTSRVIVPPIRLYDSAPICDGAAAVILAPTDLAPRLTEHHVRLLACTVSTDRFRLEDRPDPLRLQAAEWSANKAYEIAALGPKQVDFFEAHDAFSIMAALQLEAAGFAPRGEGWRLAAEKKIWRRRGRIPIATMGGLKARGHPIGASALYQACEIVLQLTGRAGKNQLRKSPKVGMMQSVGGAASTMMTHIFAK